MAKYDVKPVEGISIDETKADEVTLPVEEVITTDSIVASEPVEEVVITTEVVKPVVEPVVEDKPSVSDDNKFAGEELSPSSWNILSNEDGVLTAHCGRRKFVGTRAEFKAKLKGE